MELTVQEILNATKGKLYGKIDKNLSVKKIVRDTKEVEKNCAFIALKGDKFDGHDFIEEAFKNKALFVISSKKLKTKKPYLKVNNTLTALSDMAKYYRQRKLVQVIAVTGSNGKTTTKDIIAKILSSKFSTLKSKKSFNNFVGVPLTMFELEDKHQILVQEMETNVLGGIKKLCKVANPYAAVVTNIGDTHLQFLKNKEGVFKEKSESIESLPKWGVVVLNKDDSYYAKLKKTAGKRRVISFGIKKKADYFADKIEVKNNKINFLLNGKTKVKLNSCFYHNIYNVLAACAVCVELFDIDIKAVVKKISEFTFPKLRAQIIKRKKVTIINDCFNANPSSVEAAVVSMTKVKAKRNIVCLGDMKELGKKEIALHKKIGKVCVENRISAIVTVGKLAENIGKKALNLGMAKKNIICCQDTKEAVKSLNKILQPNDLLLIKASRSMQFENIVKNIVL